MSTRPPRIGIVLSGGGARGAYEVGVIRWLREVVPRELGYHADLRIVTGASVGAINACFMAATMERLSEQGDIIAAGWRSLRIEDVVGLGPRDLWSGVRKLMGRVPQQPKPGQFRYGGLLETGGLERTVFRMIPWRQIRRNIDAGVLDALAVSATRVGTGHTVVFIDMATSQIPKAWSQNPFVRREVTRIGPRHALASAAIPMLFPAVKIAGSFYVDGALRQNTPMSPAIRLGADKIIVVSLKHISDAARARKREQEQREREAEQAYPKPLYVAGKVLNALLLDHTDYDLDRMERINQLLEAGDMAFGDRFGVELGRALEKLRGAPLRRIEVERIRPSVDIGEISSEFVRSRRYRVQGRLARKLFDRVASAEAAHESDLISYLMFDGDYAGELIELGYNDAAAQQDRLLRLLSRD